MSRLFAIRWPNYWSFSFSISPYNEYDLEESQGIQRHPPPPSPLTSHSLDSPISSEVSNSGQCSWSWRDLGMSPGCTVHWLRGFRQAPSPF